MNKAEREIVHESIKNILVSREIIQKEIQKIYEKRNHIYSEEMQDIIKAYSLSGSLASSIFFPDCYEMIAIPKMKEREAI